MLTKFWLENLKGRDHWERNRQPGRHRRRSERYIEINVLKIM
jgi:hypothetical protein